MTNNDTRKKALKNMFTTMFTINRWIKEDITNGFFIHGKCFNLGVQNSLKRNFKNNQESISRE